VSSFLLHVGAPNFQGVPAHTHDSSVVAATLGPFCAIGMRRRNAGSYKIGHRPVPLTVSSSDDKMYVILANACKANRAMK
jgi:hypothetical protein